MKKSKNVNSLKKIFPINPEDPTTFPWLECKVSGEGNRAKIKWFKNPEFKYGHLIPNY